MTSDLALFLSRLSGRFDGAALAPYDPVARAYVERLLLLPHAEQQAILRALREQTAVCVLLLRNQKQDERELAERDRATSDGVRLTTAPGALWNDGDGENDQIESETRDQ